ncbi:MAG: hypothetical protein SGPRY_011829, partial [Prymnesium sp.]
MSEAAKRYTTLLRRSYPVIDRWLALRSRQLEPSTGTPCQLIRFSQARLWVASMYTDKLHQAVLGADLTIVGLRCWHRITRDLNLNKMAIVAKHGIGSQVTVQGVRVNTCWGAVFVPEDKARRALTDDQKASEIIRSSSGLAAYSDSPGEAPTILARTC